MVKKIFLQIRNNQNHLVTPAVRHGMKEVVKEATEVKEGAAEETAMTVVIMPEETEEMAASSAEVVAVVVNPETNN